MLPAHQAWKFQVVNADHSVTLGDHSENSRKNTVSVGAPNNERQITYVAKCIRENGCGQS